ncbi:MAG TPA: hypothetical protein VFS00_26405 [Polyangiaceae bacterium]|nr:hypothetical protein [Polyangiaceae bacterium]
MRRTVLSLLFLGACGAFGACSPEGPPDGGDETDVARQALGTCPDAAGALCLRGAASTSYLPDSNRCVPNVVAQFDAIKDHGEIMGFRDGGSPISYPPLDTDDDHWQGVQRLAFPSDHRLFMVLTSSHGSGGRYALVGLGSRVLGGLTGRRFGGNRMSFTDQDWDVAPQGNDTIHQTGLTSTATLYNHPGGIQALGQFLAVPLEVIGGGGPPGRTQLFDTGTAIDFDVDQCAGTTAGCIRSQWVFEHGQPGAGESALAKLDDGRYLMITAVSSATSVLEVNVSGLGGDGAPRPIGDPFVFGAWNSPGNGGASSAVFSMGAVPGWKPYQSLQLVTECGSGHLYLVGMEKEGDGDDWADLYRLNLRPTGALNAEGEPLVSTGSIATTFTRVRSKHFWCTYEGSPRQCDFDAATGVYVDPFGTLLVYATVHTDTAPASGVTRFVEFGPNDPVDRPDTFSVEPCDAKSKMWVEMSNQPLSGGLPPVGAERFFIEYQNETRSDANFGTAYDFHDEARSIRYCLPPGFRYKLCSDSSFGGTCQFFCGSSAAGCTGLVSSGVVRGVNLASANASSGCFTTTASSSCL